jgi:GxxExxY protein
LASELHNHSFMEPQRSPLAQKVIGCAIEVHRTLGPGLLESVYERCLAHEFALNHLRSVWQAPVPIAYKGVHIDCGYRIDCVVEGELLVELKTVERVLPIHYAQVLTYVKLLKVRQGLLINFNSRRLVDGLKSFLG